MSGLHRISLDDNGKHGTTLLPSMRHSFHLKTFQEVKRNSLYFIDYLGCFWPYKLELHMMGQRLTPGTQEQYDAIG